jgi:hypothetical protein
LFKAGRNEDLDTFLKDSRKHAYLESLVPTHIRMMGEIIFKVARRENFAMV